MSLLLDALNKADEERKRNENPPSIGSNHDISLTTDTSGNKIPVFTIAASIGVALAILFVIVYWLGRHTLVINTTSETTTTTKSTTTGATNPVTNNVQNSQRNFTKASGTQASDSNNTAATNYNQATTTKTRTTAENPSEETVASLYQQNTTNVAPAIQPTKTIANSAQLTTPTTRTETNIQPGRPDPTNPETVSSIKQFSNLPEIHDLPNNVLERIPSLNYSEHHYNSNGGNVVVNGSVKHVNDQLANGLIIDKILEDGMVLHIDTYSFKMRALNSWVNM